MFGSFMCVNKNDIVICAPILLLLLALAAIQHNTPTFGVSYNILLPYLVFYVAFIPGISFFNKFGDYSYGIYLYGWTSQQIVYSFNHNMTNCVNTILGTLLATLMGILSWHLVEKNANKLKKHLPRKKISFWRNNDK
jgi:peptidoglycan/LPS O-acetylase OafA/YrhL